jgi:hypothetical protein
LITQRNNRGKRAEFFGSKNDASALRSEMATQPSLSNIRPIGSFITARKKTRRYLSAAFGVRSHHANGVAFECDAGEIAGRVGAGIDVDTLWEDLGLHDRRVPVHDDLLKIASLVFEEFVSYP